LSSQDRPANWLIFEMAGNIEIITEPK
jgi:hypothetical protein